jgi:spore coat polysaccharide biosynthesis predicted glycosyltransferase SpsG
VGGKVLVAMGGSDFLHLTTPIVDGLKNLDIEICVAIGPTNSQRQQIEETVKSIPQARMILQADYITELASSSLAILAAGSSLWEAAALGVPSIGLIVADNQSESALAAEGLAFSHAIDCRNTFDLGAVVHELNRCLLGRAILMRESALRVKVGDEAIGIAVALTASNLDRG